MIKSRKVTAAERLEQVIAQGFDRSELGEDDDRYVHIRCSQCQALVVNGVATHETGCPNAARVRRAEQLAEMEQECD